MEGMGMALWICKREVAKRGVTQTDVADKFQGPCVGGPKYMMISGLTANASLLQAKSQANSRRAKGTFFGKGSAGCGLQNVYSARTIETMRFDQCQAERQYSGNL